MVAEEIKTYLQSITAMMERNRQDKPPKFQYWGIEDYVLQCGRFMGASSEAASQQFERGLERQCFRNAYLCALQHGLRYCEGFALGVFPVLHAWCLDEQDNVIEVTWENGTAYYGVEFDFDLVTETILQRQCYGVIDNFQQCWPLLQEHRGAQTSPDP